MDKLTLTRQFGTQFGILLGRCREGIVEWNNIDSYGSDIEEKVLY